VTAKGAVLVVVAFAAATTACATTDQRTAQRDATRPQTLPSAMEPVMVETRPVDGGAMPSVPVAHVSDPSVLTGAAVKDRAGQSIGEVRAVRLTPDGEIAAVTVDTGARTVALQPARLRYVQAENAVVSDLSKAEIQRRH
jgi:hypothetical protein